MISFKLLTVSGESGKSGLHVQVYVEFKIKLDSGKRLSTSVGVCLVREKELRERSVMHLLRRNWKLTSAIGKLQDTAMKLQN